MRTYNVSYYLGKMYHTYAIEATNETEAIKRALKAIHYPETMHDFKIRQIESYWG